MSCVDLLINENEMTVTPDLMFDDELSNMDIKQRQAYDPIMKNIPQIELDGPEEPSGWNE